MRTSFHPSLTIHCQFRWTSPRTQVHHLWSTRTLPKIRQCPTVSATSVFHQTTSLCQSQILPHHPTIQKTLRQICRSFEIIAKPGTHSFTIRLPKSMRGVHPVFHISMLEPTTPNKIPNWTQSLPPLIDIDREPEFEIAEVVDSKIDKWRRCKLLYYICWLGYEDTNEEFSWLPAMELEQSMELVADFHSTYLTKLGPLAHI